MSEHPKLGMFYETARKKLKGPLGKDPAIRSSILNQARLHEGETAKSELEKELSFIKKGSHSFSGAGTKQTGIGNGKSLGDGHWVYENQKWIRR